MNQPTPNSPEFAKLTAGEQRNILEDRAIEVGFFGLPATARWPKNFRGQRFNII